MTADQRSVSMLPHFRTYCPVQLQLTMIVGLLVVALGCDPIAETEPDSRAKQSDVTDQSGVSSEGSSLPAIQPEEKVTALDRDESLAAVDSFLNEKKPDQAVSLLKAMLVKNPTDVEVIFYILTKKMRNDGPYVTKAAVRKTRQTVRKMKHLCDMYDDLRPAAKRRAPARRASSVTQIKN